ncbi:MAG: hypothetical protein WC683_04345 [bacterium]
MIITIQSGERDYYTHQRMKVNGKEKLSIGPLCECPEDAIVGRSLVDCDQVLDLMREAHAAGARGEVLEIVNEPFAGE